MRFGDGTVLLFYCYLSMVLGVSASWNWGFSVGVLGFGVLSRLSIPIVYFGAFLVA